MGTPLQTVDEELLGRIRGGDRAAVAEFIREHEPLIRRRFRHKLGVALRRVVDSEELVSTLSRRLDAYIATGHLTATTQPQLWALIMKVAERSVFDKLRELQRSPTATGESTGGPGVEEPLDRAGALASELSSDRSLDEILRMIPEADREIAHAWLRGLDFNTIGQQTGKNPEAVRQRWHRIKLELRTRLDRD